jgi:hypothetical protein
MSRLKVVCPKEVSPVLLLDQALELVVDQLRQHHVGEPTLRMHLEEGACGRRGTVSDRRHGIRRGPLKESGQFVGKNTVPLVALLGG